MKTSIQSTALQAGAESVMIDRNGCEVIAYLDWNETSFLVWIEPSDVTRETATKAELNECEEACKRYGVQRFYNLPSVNAFLQALSYYERGSAVFYEDAVYGICGG